MIILTDIHGNYDTMLALLAKIPEEEKQKGIVICGDLIDRGPKSKEVVEWVIKNKIPTVKGNHEQMMIDWVNNGCNGHDLHWMHNGGDFCLNSYNEVPIDLFKAHVKWMESLPLFIEYPDLKLPEGRHLVISHSNIGNVWEKRNDNGAIQNTVLWGREHYVKDSPEIYNVIGHTPQEGGPTIHSYFANIDTGCFYVRIGFGKLTALQFPEMIVYEQENIEGELNVTTTQKSKEQRRSMGNAREI